MANNELIPMGNANDIVLRPNYPMSTRQKRETHTLRDTHILFRNFAGKKGDFNEEGVRSFAVLLDENLAKYLTDHGLNVKPLRLREEGDQQMYYLPVAVSFRIRPPRIYMVTGDGIRMPLRKTMLSEDLVEMMDNLDLSACHMVIAISNYDVRGVKGKKAYLQSFFGHVEMDELEEEYASVEDMVLDDTEKHAHVDNVVIEGEIVE